MKTLSCILLVFCSFYSAAWNGNLFVITDLNKTDTTDFDTSIVKKIKFANDGSGPIKILPEPTGMLCGLVLNKHKKPVKYQTVTISNSAYSGEALADSTGYFVIEKIPPGVYDVSIFNDDKYKDYELKNVKIPERQIVKIQPCLKFNLVRSFLNPFKRLTGKVKLKKLFADLPKNTFAFQLFDDTTVTLYFKKSEWSSEINKLATDSFETQIYFKYLDSLQKISKSIDLANLPNTYHVSPTHFSYVGASWEVFNILIQRGHLHIKRFDNSILSKIKIIKSSTKKSISKNYLDAEWGWQIHSISHNKYPGF